jgi:uncharacterized protein (TIGR02466 family)
MTRHKLWQTYFLEEINPNHKKIKNQLTQCVYDFDSKTQQSKIGRALKNNISEPPLNFLDSALANCPAFGQLMSWIDTRMKSFVRPIIKTSINPDLKWGIRHHEGWYHITKKGGFHGPHMHSNTSWGWIYYLEDLDNERDGGRNKFYNPLSQHVTYVDVGLVFMANLDWSFFEVTPSAGKLIVYPGWLLHDAQPYWGKKDRVILSGNTQILEISKALCDDSEHDLFLQ